MIRTVKRNVLFWLTVAFLHLVIATPAFAQMQGSTYHSDSWGDGDYVYTIQSPCNVTRCKKDVESLAKIANVSCWPKVHVKYRWVEKQDGIMTLALPRYALPKQRRIGTKQIEGLTCQGAIIEEVGIQGYPSCVIECWYARAIAYVVQASATWTVSADNKVETTFQQLDLLHALTDGLLDQFLKSLILKHHWLFIVKHELQR
jgi:hypothetical protein